VIGPIDNQTNLVYSFLYFQYTFLCNDVHLLFQLGTKSLREGRPEQAIANFTKILELTPQSAKAIFNRAVAKRQAGDLNGALKDYDSVIKISPKDNQAYRNRGIVKQLLGSQIGACADWGIASGLGDLEVREWIRDECR
jgi:Flp pilus assembly protein TadD